MIEKTQVKEATAPNVTTGRFAFMLTANGNIVCKRSFNITNFQERSLPSANLAESMDKCVNMINEDLKRKTEIYLRLSAPQVFKDPEEMAGWLERHPNGLEPGGFVVFREKEGVYMWDGEKIRPYEKPYNRNEYIGAEETEPFELKLSFLDEDEEVRSVSWDGSVYPKFVRTNIDLSNSKNKYSNGDQFAPFESALINAFNSGAQSIIPRIMRQLEYACNAVNLRYFTKLRYGDRRLSLEVGKYFHTHYCLD